MSSMRIIAGRWRSRRIEAPLAHGTRPVPDRVKGAVFDILGSRLGTPGALPPVCVADFFAGSGSMGLEAVSRGARGCVFVERRPEALRVLRRNLDRLQAGPSLRLVGADAWTYPSDRVLPLGQSWGLIFVDPPYRDSRDSGPGGKVSCLLARLVRAGCVESDTLVVLHHERTVCYEWASACEQDPGWSIAARREYGTTAVSFFTLAAGTEASGSGAAETGLD